MSGSFPYIYRWNRQGRKGQLCALEVRGTKNSCLLVFEDGYRMVTSRNALMKNSACNSATLDVRISNEMTTTHSTAARGAELPHSGATSPEKAAPVFHYVLRSDRSGHKKGEFCRQITRTQQHACVEFADGFRIVVPRSVLKRRPEYKDSVAMATVPPSQ